MKKILGRTLMVLGLLLVLGAAWLLMTNRQEDTAAGESAAQVLEAMETLETAPAASASTEETTQEVPERDMTVKTVDGREYIGTLLIPNLDLELPVLSEWSYDGLKIAPGRYAGSLYADDLVICGHNYTRHFNPIKRLTPGEEVEFVDMDGTVWEYEVSAVETIQPTQIEEMVGKTEGDDWDLTLFTCTAGGTARCAVRCVRVQNDS